MITSDLAIRTDNLAADMNTLHHMLKPSVAAQPPKDVVLGVNRLSFNLVRGDSISVEFVYTGEEVAHLLDELVTSLEISFIPKNSLLLTWTMMGLGVDAYWAFGEGPVIEFSNPDVVVPA